MTTRPARAGSMESELQDEKTGQERRREGGQTRGEEVRKSFSVVVGGFRASSSHESDLGQ